ncbi:MAG TPA: dTMP kinase [Kofleriaceae bacterium]|nr:dTMP kinase [Kofleriaceae bacterium]
MAGDEQAGRDGVLVALEGIDGAGTTTQARLLVGALEARGVAAHLTREPSDGPVGRLLREILAGRHAPTDATTHALLFAADRADHIQREVEPALAAGQLVVSDRWFHSSLAYQGAGEERAWIAELNCRARPPDLTIFLRVAPEVAAERRAASRAAEELFDALAMQRRVARGYDEVMAELGTSQRIEILDGEQPVDRIAAACLALVLSLSPSSPSPSRSPVGAPPGEERR